MGEDDELVQAFLEESRENLDQLDLDLVALETDPTDGDLLARVFRAVHTIKGTCGFLGFTRLEALAHAGEDLLGALRNGTVILDPHITTTLLRLVDDLREMLDQIEATGAEGDLDSAATIAALAEHLASDEGASTEPGAGAEQHGATTIAAETTVRVHVAVLDQLMDLVGELVQARNEIGEIARRDDDGPLTLPYRQLRVAMGDLQERVMRARLQPVGAVTGKFRRVVRDLALDLGKQVRLRLEGEDVGVDRAVNEALADPLVHLVRNAIDHGIETPEERRALGKAAEGQIRISAFHEGGRVQIEISDDGRGIDPGTLVERAVTNGMLTPEEATLLSGQEALELIFRPGLSTKGEVTNLSGRGVGMDVVRASLERVGGSIEVFSDPGRGSRFRLSVPLTLAIMPSVITWSGGQRYAIPQVEVEEVVHLDERDLERSVDDVAGARMYRLRGRLLPLVDLASQFGLAPDQPCRSLTLVVIDAAQKRFGLVVDGVGDMTDVVVKPLTAATRSIDVFAGVTVLGDGCPALILDSAGLATRAGIIGGAGASAPGAPEATLTDRDPFGLLVFSSPDGGRFAVRMSDVSRLEQFPREAVERTGTIDVVQYGDAVLPLVRVLDAFGNIGSPAAVLPNEASEMLQTVVCRSQHGAVGLVVHGIEDIVTEPPAPAQASDRRGVAATFVVDNRVTELLDLEVLLADVRLVPSA